MAAAGSGGEEIIHSGGKEDELAVGRGTDAVPERRDKRGGGGFAAATDVELHLVNRDHLEEGDVAGGDEVGEDSLHPLRIPAVKVVAGRNPDRVRAEAGCLESRHGGAHTESSRLIRAGRHHATAGTGTDDDWFADQTRVLELLHRREERVQVDMDDPIVLGRRRKLSGHVK